MTVATTLQLTIDGQPVEVRAGATVLDAINQLGISIPQLCKDPDRPPLGACRTCLVQIEGVRGFPASCSTPARDGMVVQTRSPELLRIRRGVLELTLGMLPKALPLLQPATPGGEGAVAGAGNGQRGNGSTLLESDGSLHLLNLASNGHAAGGPGLGQLQVAAVQHGISVSRYQPFRSFTPDATKSFFVLDRDLCILCGRCTDACNNVQRIGAIQLLYRGRDTKVGVFGDLHMADSICTSCGQCVATCPTNAIRPKWEPVEIVREVKTTCPYCGVGCGITVEVSADERVVRVQDEPANLSSLGMLCVKGRFGTTYIQSPDRLTTPLIRKNGKLEPASWDEALDLIAEKFAEHRGHFAALASAKGTNEDSYVEQKFVRAIMGTNNIDHCTRLCHSPSVEAMLVQLGSGATSNSYIDYEEAGCLMVVGSDATNNHPVAAVRFRKAVANGAKLIVVNPKRVDLCYYADIWLQQKPGTDVALFNGLARIILDEGLWDRDFVLNRTEGFEAWRASLEAYTPERVSEITGVPTDLLRAAARTYARPPFHGSCLIWGMGITQHTNGTANAHALLNLALVAGQLGKPASGISPLRGQNNVQGCGDAGCIPDALPGYQRYTNPQVRARFEAVWGLPIPTAEGLRVTEMMEAMERGEIRAFYCVGENPMLSEPDLAHAWECMSKLDFLVVQDIFMHETCELAHVVLPACGFAEKDGTFTNSERRVQRVRQAIQPRGEARPDWAIVCEIARRTAAKLGFQTRGFDFQHPSEIWAEMASLVPFLAGISYERLEAGGIQWPCPTPDHPGTRYMYAESFPRGPRALFVPVEQTAPAAELPDNEYPLVLNTGRVLYHWHGGTITRRVQGLVDLSPDVEVSVHPADAEQLGINTGDAVVVESRRGRLVGRARVTRQVRRGSIFVPFVKLKQSAANFLTNSAYDPSAKIPEYKVCAVRVRRAEADEAAELAQPVAVG